MSWKRDFPGQGVPSSDQLDLASEHTGENRKEGAISSDSTGSNSLAENNLEDASLSEKCMADGECDSGAMHSDGRRRKRYRRDTIIRIMSASYGPSDGRRLLNGEFVHTEAKRVPYTRDVLPILRALLEARVCTRASANDTERWVTPAPSSSGGSRMMRKCPVMTATAHITTSLRKKMK